MHLRRPTALLGGRSPAAFMRDFWQKRPLLIRQALPGAAPPLSPSGLFALAARDDVESRLIVRSLDNACAAPGWRLRHGPFPRRGLPPLKQPGWTLLVQGLDLHVEAAHVLLQRFRWIADARLDDLMISFATDGGGVGAHIDSYDVFLLQVQGRRRWRIGPVKTPVFQPDTPLRLLTNFEPAEEWLLEPGDMLYLPPRWGHDGEAVGACMTCSIGFRAPRGEPLARELLQRLLDEDDEDDEPGRLPSPGRDADLFRDPPHSATATPGRLPEALIGFARDAVARRLRDPAQIDRALGEILSEPKPRVWFEANQERDDLAGVRLDRRTRMMYDERHVYINGESLRASGRDARAMRLLADERRLDAAQCARLSADARGILADWVRQGWAHDDGFDQD